MVVQVTEVSDVTHVLGPTELRLQLGHTTQKHDVEVLHVVDTVWAGHGLSRNLRRVRVDRAQRREELCNNFS